MSDPTLHQQYSAFPRLDSPAIDLDTGYWTPPWYRFLIGLWQKAGGSFSKGIEDTFGQQKPASSDEVFLFNSLTGQLISPVPLAWQKIPQELPGDLPEERESDVRAALGMTVPGDTLDPDQMVMLSLARQVPFDL